MKKSLKALCCGLVLAVCSTVAFAQSNHGKILPDFSEGFSSENVYFGAEGIFSFPVLFTGDYKIAGTGFGAALEAGYDLSGWLFGTHLEFRKSMDNGNYMKSLNNVFLTAEVSKIIGNELFSFIPSAIDFRPTFGVGLNAINTEYYKNEHFKNNNVLTKEKGCSLVYNLGVEVEYTKLDKIIPYAGIDWEMAGDKGGVFNFTGVNVGVRTTVGKVFPKKELTLSITPASEYFTPDGDGKLDVAEFNIKSTFLPKTTAEEWKIEISETNARRTRVIKTFSGTGKPPKKIQWEGDSDLERFMMFSVSEFDVKMTMKDTNGTEVESETKISTGLLVQEAGDGKYKIRVPAIAFDANAATFDTLTERELRSNKMILNTLAKGLSKYPNYQILVVGHANNISGTEKEEIEELIPLSTERAKVIMQQLIEMGINESQLSAEGHGGREPIATGDDIAKNRRVEFILTRE